MAEYFDAYRIDHILGFFRIWEIPMHAVHGLLGQFDPSLPMSREEIESYGLTFRDEYLLPFIHESFLGQLFGPHTHLVKQDFLESVDDSGLYRMKPGFETQREVEQFFIGRNDEDSVWIREGALFINQQRLILLRIRKRKVNTTRASVCNGISYSGR